MNKINVGKLDRELRKAGIPIEGCSNVGVIWFMPEATEEAKDLAYRMMGEHDPTPEKTDLFTQEQIDEIKRRIKWQV